MDHIKSESEEILAVAERLTLQAVNERFINPLWEVIKRHRTWLQQSMNWPEDVTGREDIERTVKGNAILHQRGYSKMYMVIADGMLVGVLSFNQIEPTNKTAYIGYWRTPDCPRKGVISQSLQTLMAHYSGRGIIRRFVIKCIVTNVASNRVAIRNGFTLEGRLRQAEYLNGRYQDQHIYARIFEASGQPESNA